MTDPVDVRYLSGFRGDDATLVVGHGAALLCTDSRFWEQVHEEVRDFELSKVTTEPLLAHSVREAARVLGAGARLGYQGAQLSHASYRKLRRLHAGPLRDVRQGVTLLRAVKDEAEIAVLRRAAAVTDEALRRVVARGLVGRTRARRGLGPAGRVPPPGGGGRGLRRHRRRRRPRRPGARAAGRAGHPRR